jgi:L-iditol 2-dehydrogenase
MLGFIIRDDSPLRGLKALFLDSALGLSLREIERPSPKQGEVLVKMRASGICGTDVEKVKGHGITSRILGHEVVGDVAELGEGVGGLSRGDRVFTHHHTPCLSCELCRRGEPTLCPDFGRSNIIPCGFSEYYIVPQWNVVRGAIIKLPSGLNYEEASLIEPLACCLRAIRRVDGRSTSRVLIFGAGPIGLLHVKLLNSLGIEHMEVADVKEHRLEFARKIGVERTLNPSSTNDRSILLERGEEDRPELVIVATGSPSAFRDAMTAVAKGGRVLLFGAPSRGSTVELNLEAVFMRGVNLVTSYSATESETNQATEMLGRSSISVSDLITHRFPLARAVEAFRTAEQEECMKAVVVD